jgi:outer membrane protein assembly factor BamC
MTTRKKSLMTFPGGANKAALLTLMFAGLSGCTSVNSALEGEHIDYKSAGKATTPRLDIPPDLTQLQRDNRYQIPDTAKGVATASGYAQAQTAKPDTNAATQLVAPKSAGGVRIEREGSQRWLVVNATPEALWPQLKEFWQDSGFLINVESPGTGVMETDWAENRAKIPQGFIRNTLGKVFDSLYSTGERDKFRTRLERGPDGTTEIFISHRGAEEVLTGDKSTSVWTARAPDPSLEAEFLSRLMVRLGVEETKAKVAVANAPDQQSLRAQLDKDATGAYVQVDESFDRAWRRVGLALDRVGFTVEDRDRNQGLYFVRYVDQSDDAKNKGGSGFFGNLFSGSKDKDKTAQRYRIQVKDNSGANSRISVLNNNGQPEVSKTADRILALLSEQLK